MKFIKFKIIIKFKGPECRNQKIKEQGTFWPILKSSLQNNFHKESTKNELAFVRNIKTHHKSLIDETIES